MFMATAAFAGFEATFALLGQDRFGFDEGSAAAVFVVIGIVLVIVQGGLIAPAVHRVGELRLLRLALTLNIGGLVLLAFAHSWLVLVPALALLVLGQGFATPTIATLVSNRARQQQRGQALGVQQSVSALARIVGPALAGRPVPARRHPGARTWWVRRAWASPSACSCATAISRPARCSRRHNRHLT